MGRRVKELYKGKDYTPQEILRNNLHKYYQGDYVDPKTYTEEFKNTHVKKVNNYKRLYSPKIPKGVTVKYTAKFEVKAATRAMVHYYEKKYSSMYNNYSDIEKEMLAKSQAAWEKAVERAVYDIYKDLMRMTKIGLTEYYAQYSPRKYPRTGSQMGAISVTISGSGVDTTVNVSFPGGGGYVNHGGRAIPGVVETGYIVNGERALGHDSNVTSYPLTWAFSYSSSILGAYISSKMYATYEAVFSNFGEIVSKQARKYYNMYFSM